MVGRSAARHRKRIRRFRASRRVAQTRNIELVIRRRPAPVWKRRPRGRSRHFQSSGNNCMKKTLTQRLEEMARQAENGTLELPPCDEYVTGRTKEEFDAALEELKRWNEI